MGEGLVKLSHVKWRTWTCGGVAHSWKTASKRVRYQSQTRTIQRLSARYQTVLAIFLGFRKLFYRRNVPLLHTSKYIHRCTWLTFTRPSPALVLQVTNTGVKSPGYKASLSTCHSSILGLYYPVVTATLEKAGLLKKAHSHWVTWSLR